jgi:hypothetical protein
LWQVLAVRHITVTYFTVINRNRALALGRIANSVIAVSGSRQSNDDDDGQSFGARLSRIGWKLA